MAAPAEVSGPEPRERVDVRPPRRSDPRITQTLVLVLFTVASFVGAGLLFLVQPMAAKMVLPALGGTPAVWNTAMLFFQAMLLAGYGYAHLTTMRLGPRRQALVHAPVLFLPLLVLPFVGPSATPDALFGSMELAVLVLFFAMVGLPFFVVATASPLLQRWLADTDHPAGRDPYFLYAAGNAGSLLALLSYPFVVERVLDTSRQAWLWTGGYALFAALGLACVVVVRRSRRAPAPPAVGERGPAAATAAARPVWRARLGWIACAFIPSSLLLGVTTYLSTDIAAAPLLWVVPLALYLLTYIVAFAGWAPLTLLGRVVPVLVVALLASILLRVQEPVVPIVVLHLGALLAVGLLAHGRVAAARPAPARLTEFYFMLSLGGVLGGVFNALVAPVAFTSLVEYPLVLVLALALGPQVAPAARRLLGVLSPRVLPPVAGFLAVLLGLLLVATRAEVGPLGLAAVVLLAGAVAGALFSAAERVPRVTLAGGLAVLVVVLSSPGAALVAERTFFGVHRVSLDDERHVLSHGTTVHGMESFAAGLAGEPLSYYSRGGPFGDVAAATVAGGADARVAVVGLGTGALAAYGEAGQRYDFYEIDPVVAELARDPELFTYLSRTRADATVVLGDGRLALADAEGDYDLIVLDAFSSDAIPVHLLTREAVELYLDKLAPGGALVFHISNRFLDLEPVLAATARELGLVSLVGTHRVAEGDADHGYATSSQWLVMSSYGADLLALEDTPRWAAAQTTPHVAGWTDAYSNIVSVLRRW